MSFTGGLELPNCPNSSYFATKECNIRKRKSTDPLKRVSRANVCIVTVQTRSYQFIIGPHGRVENKVCLTSKTSVGST